MKKAFLNLVIFSIFVIIFLTSCDSKNTSTADSASDSIQNPVDSSTAQVVDSVGDSSSQNLDSTNQDVDPSTKNNIK